MFRNIEHLEDERPHILPGVLIVFAFNFFVIIGIIGNLSFLLIPWLLFYCVGKFRGLGKGRVNK